MLNYTLYLNNNTDQWVTFVHGAGGSSSIWFKQIRDFKANYNILLLDLRGHGKSKTSFEFFNKRYTFPFLANDIIEVLDFLKITKSHFVGISLGTILIRQLAEMQPNRVQTMVLGGAILKIPQSFYNFVFICSSDGYNCAFNSYLTWRKRIDIIPRNYKGSVYTNKLLCG